LKPETLGLTLAEGKTILKSVQRILIQRQASSGLVPHRQCPDCGSRRASKGYHDLSLRTVFGCLKVKSPRLHHCHCRPHDSGTFSPLADLLPDHTTPELLFLETKWASLMSYGMTAKLLQDVLPMDDPLNAFTIRRHVWDVAERLEQELGEERDCFIEGCQRDWDKLPAPDGPLTVGIDGGYVRGQRKQGHFEVIAGKSILAFKREPEQKPELSGRCFAFVQTYDEKPKRRLFELLQAHGMQPNQQVEFLSDGGEDVRQVQLSESGGGTPFGLVPCGDAADVADRQRAAGEGRPGRRPIRIAARRDPGFGIGQVVFMAWQRIPGIGEAPGPGDGCGVGSIRNQR
jgi:hypothetical protein